MRWNARGQTVLFEEDPYYLASQTGVAQSCSKYLKTRNSDSLTKELFIFLVLYCGFPIEKNFNKFKAKYKDNKRKGYDKFKYLILKCKMNQSEYEMTYNGSKTNIYEIKNVLKSYTVNSKT